MEKAERTRYRQLALDTIIGAGIHSPEARLAEALEACVDDLDFIAHECDHCKTCAVHGDHADDALPVDADEVLDAHKELKTRLTELETFRDKLAKNDVCGSEIAQELADFIQDLSDDIDSVEACVVS